MYTHIDTHVKPIHRKGIKLLPYVNTILHLIRLYFTPSYSTRLEKIPTRDGNKIFHISFVPIRDFARQILAYQPKDCTPERSASAG